MSDSVIESVADAVRAAREIQALLEGRGDLSGALCLCKATGAFYSTSSEALIGILQALKQASTSGKLSGSDLQHLASLQSDITLLLDLR
jgi:hypothetical protein